MSFVSARERAGYTQAEVAKRLDVDQSAVSLWETGRNFPRASMLVKMADLYACTIDDLLGRELKAQDSA